MDISLFRDRELGGALTVAELNNFIKNLLDTNKTLSAVSVTGEISNLKDHGSGHLYFSLKDADSQIKAVMFRSQRSRLKFVPEDGMRVTVHGSVSIYSQTGTVQIYANSIEPDGIGALYLAYERLKERLALEGLFDEEHKKPIPEYPRRIGVITSPSGAAVRDVINVTKRRYPLAEVFIYPSLVQGDGAEASLIRALDYFEASHLVDVIIIGRGGGSIEDLWAFNGERLARAIYECNIPIISAVGHETDFTICDFVCDLRAPTPSAAAELAVPDVREISMNLDGYLARLDTALIGQIARNKDRLAYITDSPVMRNPESIVQVHRERLIDATDSLNEALTDLCKRRRNDFALVLSKVEAMNPLAVLSRGFSVVSHNGSAVTDASLLKASDTINVRMSKGSLKAKVIECER